MSESKSIRIVPVVLTVRDVPSDAGVAVGDIVYVDSAGILQKALAIGNITSRAVGICVAKTTPTRADITTHGVTPAVLSGIVEGQDYRLSTTTAGTLTTSVASGNDEVVVFVATGLNANQLIINIHEGYEIDTD